MAQTSVSFRIDKETKTRAERVCKELGLSMSAAISVFLTKVARERRIPFELSADPFYSEENMARLRASVAQMEATGGEIHEVNLDGEGMD